MDGRTDGIAVASTALAMRALWRAVINQQEQNTHASLTKNTANINTNKVNPGSVASYDLRPGNGTGPYSGM